MTGRGRNARAKRCGSAGQPRPRACGIWCCRPRCPASRSTPARPATWRGPSCNCSAGTVPVGTRSAKCSTRRRTDALKRHCEARSDEAIQHFRSRLHGLLRGACHRARIRATRWLAMTKIGCSPSPACGTAVPGKDSSDSNDSSSQSRVESARNFQRRLCCKRLLRLWKIFPGQPCACGGGSGWGCFNKTRS